MAGPGIQLSIPQDSQTKEVQTILQDLEELPTDEHLPIRKLGERLWEQERVQKLEISAKNIAIHCCDFRRLGVVVSPGSVDLIITDPPWGKWKQLAHPRLVQVKPSVTSALVAAPFLPQLPKLAVESSWAAT
jgi:hypothetical protein